MTTFNTTDKYILYEFTVDELIDIEEDGLSFENPNDFLAIKDYGSRVGSAETLEELEELFSEDDSREKFIWDGRRWHN